MSQNLLATGVYVIRHIATGKVYVGSASRSFRSRWSLHQSLLRRGKHHSRTLQRAWDQDGPDAFEWIIVEYAPAERCIAREQWWLDILSAADGISGYNCCKEAGRANPLGRKHSAATKAAISAAHSTPKAIAEKKERMRTYRHTPEVRAKISAAHKARVKTPEELAAIRKAAALRRGRSRTPEQRARQSATLKGRPFTPEHRANLSGQNNHNAVNLTPDQVRQIRIRIASGKPEDGGYVLAREFNVGDSVIYRIASGEHWLRKEIGETAPIEIPRRARSEEHLAKLRATLPHKHGEANVNAKLTEDKVREIRRRYVPGSRTSGSYALARELGVTASLVLAVVKRHIWKHVA